MLLLFCAAWMALASEAFPDFSIAGRPRDDADRPAHRRPCTVDELLPNSTIIANSRSSEWSEQNTARDPYGCGCSFTRGRYFCPSREKDQGYPQWEPRVVSEGVCDSVTRSQLSEAPLPPGFKVLIYGNSHLRQVVEALMCLFPEKVKEKSVSFSEVSKEGRQNIRGGATCRQSSAESWATLIDHHCVVEDYDGAGKHCSDDIGEFFMTNGAIVHYYYAGPDRQKSIRDALPFHNSSPDWFHYDAVFANSGNQPSLSQESVLISAFELQQAAVPFFWLSEYDGVGHINGWEASKVSRFHESGAKFVDIRSMTHGLRSLTKGAVESGRQSQGGSNVGDDSFLGKIGGDPHFCLPGPPDEMAVLLLKLMWAVHQGNY